MMTSREIRQSFFDFFASKGHVVVPSSPVVLPSDPTLLFANAGMNQFKDVFLGARDPAAKRVANTQKCIRVSGKHNDLEEVGYDTYHHTFFEMLGNWSFGDYYKKEAIAWAWELMTEIWKLDKSRLWATVYRTDEEAMALWKSETDIDPDHILRFDEKDNFWEMGETGPCGPCSEIHYDLTPAGDATPEMVNAGLPELIEIWNLVFMQYNRRSDASLEELTSKHVDTGMGLERIVAVLQGKASNYDTDVFRPLLDRLVELSGREYAGDAGVAMRVCADHVRTLAFAIADGVTPSNDGRGYVLRRLLRRAVRYGRNLGFEQPFLCELFPTLEAQLAAVFPELAERRESIVRTLRAEEESFSRTLDRGLALFEAVAVRVKDGVFPGDEAFRLYDTYGFPFDLTALMAREKGLETDEAEFDRLMEEQRARARAARSTDELNSTMDLVADLVADGACSTFVGYDRDEAETEVIRVLANGSVVLRETPFYPEGGGQIGDCGVIRSADAEFRVSDVKKPAEGIVLHVGEPLSGELCPGDRVTATVDRARRADLRRHHTATHLLNQALREVVDASVKQAGSRVAPDSLRFDFNHFAALSSQQLREIERVVNRKILENLPVETVETSLSEVQRSDDIQAVFDDKYGEVVRVVKIGDFSKELCGGTHVSRTAEIGSFRILSESSVAAGIRRIEATVGMPAFELAAAEHDALTAVAGTLSAKPEEAPDRVRALSEQVRKLEKELKAVRVSAALEGIEALLARIEHLQLHDEVEHVPLLASAGDAPPEAMRELMDRLRQKLDSGVVVLGSNAGGKAAFICSVTPDLVERGIHAGKLVGAVAKIAGGGGGGRPDRAQAGGKDGSKVQEAIDAVPSLLRERLSK